MIGKSIKRFRRIPLYLSLMVGAAVLTHRATTVDYTSLSQLIHHPMHQIGLAVDSKFARLHFIDHHGQHREVELRYTSTSSEALAMAEAAPAKKKAKRSSKSRSGWSTSRNGGWFNMATGLLLTGIHLWSRSW